MPLNSFIITVVFFIIFFSRVTRIFINFYEFDVTVLKSVMCMYDMNF